jgi:hypothetical protein
MKTQEFGPMAGLALAAALWIGASTSAHAAFQWVNINTPPSPYNLSGQLKLEVLGDGSGSTLTLKFVNDVGIASSITDIYVDAPPPGAGESPTPFFVADSLQIAVSGPGVAFSPNANPADLPAGNQPQWDFTASASADSDSGQGGVSEHGINSSTEWLKLTWTLTEPTTVNDVIAQLNNGQFRVGLHIQSLPDGSSASWMTVPEPTTILAGALLLLPFGWSTVRIMRRNRAA